ncbi:MULTISPECIES: glycosyltransferase family 2 protein [Alteromonadaceae]|uniref:glycosyltransferase family 2 protein n=1 Tax=Alteromonadaceae TaxID=72275 RepID=UPI001C097561|nr:MULTISPECIES: glycosyltransferase family 2 protein [unclassified Aliiglaciecola]MBU2879821.1 glycosyltransferase family 2 protein [Aliiglaciecola lipolytica]MDO6709900.1 glycosyltransferase family 2 protein [Aliiglaciecola sp. 2_MG-2023]MDO6751048.1 glycosyltransferase family 2 protein [Aliiglaciecola sp. 1_MG-2023]
MDISVVIPAKNEQDNIIPLIEEIVAVLNRNNEFEIVYVDDGSDDNTYSNLCLAASSDYPQVKPIRHKYSVGQSKAIHTGVSFAKGKLIITLDADGQNDPADIPDLLKEAQKFPVGAHFCIAGYRKNRKDTAWKRMQSKIANNIRSRILRDNTPDTGCGLKIFPKSTFLQLPYFDHMHRFLPALVRRLGGKIVVVEVSHRDRQYGTSKYNMLGRLRVGIVDLLGVMWLQRRGKIALLETTHEQ